VQGPGGQFVLELPMGVLSAYLPSEKTWAKKSPDWAVDLYPQLRNELQAWCKMNKAELIIDDSAQVF